MRITRYFSFFFFYCYEWKISGTSAIYGGQKPSRMNIERARNDRRGHQIFRACRTRLRIHLPRHHSLTAKAFTFVALDISIHNSVWQVKHGCLLNKAERNGILL